MARFAEWLKRTALALVDPQREERLNAWAAAVEGALASQRDSFRYEEASVRLGIPQQDDKEVAERVYERAVRKVWRDLEVTQRERAALDYLLTKLPVNGGRARAVEYRVGRERFEDYFARAIEDGRIDPHEAAALQQIARSLATDLGTLVRQYFATESESLLRALFLSVVEEGRFGDEDWTRLMAAAAGLGLERSDVLKAIGAHGEQFIERVLAEAKSDGRLDEREQRYLVWLLDRLEPSAQFRTYVLAQLKELRQLTDIADGRLPSLRSSKIVLRAGEVVHFEGPAQYVQTRFLASGPRAEQHAGIATITDLRLVFTSPTRSLNVPLRRVLAIVRTRRGVEIKASGKGSGLFLFHDDRFAVPIFEAAVKRANQTLVDQAARLPARHIPRDVRQRVWQKYGGRCAECGATDYLEFDHIIPVSRGGSNAETNVQLLCRRCNLEKSDTI